MSGPPLALRFTVVDASSCVRLSDAAVDIWHPDAAGVYSGVPGNRGNLLRGVQRTNARGVARFVTIFPGWYRGGTPHIHRSGRRGSHRAVFFRPAVARRIHSTGVHRSREQADTSNIADASTAPPASGLCAHLRARGAATRER